MTKSEIFKTAHKLAKETVSYVGDYLIAFSIALKEVYSNMKERTAEQLAEVFTKVEGVISASAWEKHGKRRVYIETQKLNGGKNWNGGRAGTMFFDLDSGDFIWKDWAGAKTRDHGFSVIERLKEVI